MRKGIMSVIRIMLAVVLGFMCVFARTHYSFASEYASGPYVILDSYEVDGGTVVPGKKFNLKITVRNVDSNRIARDVVVSISSSAGIMPNYTEVPQKYVGDLNPGDSVEVEFGCMAQESCSPPATLFGVSISTDSRSNAVTVSVPVAGRQDVVSVVSAVVPKEANAGGTVASEIRFRTIGDDSYSDVTMEVSVDGVLYDSYRIGNISSGAVKTQSATLYLYEPGEHSLLYVVKCTDSRGVVNEVKVYEGNIKIIPSEIKSNDAAVSYNRWDRYTSRDIGIMIGCALGALILLVGIVIVSRKNR